MKTKIQRISNYAIGGVEVVNLAHCKDWGRDDGDIVVDRRTPYGNKYRMVDDSDSERDRVCDQYAAWLEERLKKEPDFLLHLIGAKRLGCWCAPKRCHAESLARAIVTMRRTHG
jgi:hypothetical protein